MSDRPATSTAKVPRARLAIEDTAINPRLQEVLDAAAHVIAYQGVPGPRVSYRGEIHVGVDLGTAYTVLVVLDESMMPIAGAYQFAEVVRDGVVFDFMGAIAIVKKLKLQVEEALGRPIESAATAYPPGVPLAEVRATGNVLQGAGIECSRLVDEATAASTILQIDSGVVVDVGGGTTKLAVIEGGKVVYTADEPTGGTQFTLVVAGAMHIPFMEAEALKTNASQQPTLFPAIKPVMEKVATIVSRHVEGYHPRRIYLCGGSARFPGMDQVIEQVTGIETVIPGEPLFVTPIGIAMNNVAGETAKLW
ncbi:MAG TPA: ethanolamine utilization protein EutJ [Candidatus Cryosericum sp.]|jgi:ethanolamine utilization protein EutJ|nr:ethanolamine utilization protein EutJ [Candidatus Cryosericum sp.]HPS69205.1 ethanolamine utilization protein EutJ [Candidatus Cryosericum sp.]